MHTALFVAWPSNATRTRLISSSTLTTFPSRPLTVRMRTRSPSTNLETAFRYPWCHGPTSWPLSRRRCTHSRLMRVTVANSPLLPRNHAALALNLTR